MPSIPDYIENDTSSLKKTLEVLLSQYDELAAASGYFDLKGFNELRKPLAGLKKFRLLLGTEPTIPRLAVAAVPTDFPDEDFKRDLEREEFAESVKKQVQDLRAFLSRKGVEVRIYRKSFFHAKAYIFQDLAIVGSSNFTGAGLTANAELNAVEKNGIVVGHGYQKWFEKFWEQAEPWTGQFRELLNRSKFGDHPYSPYLLYIRTLWETFRDELEDEDHKVDVLTSKVELTEFQKEGIRAIRKKLERFRGVIVSDSVGLGKTFLGKKLLEEWGYFRRQPCLIICPAQLRPMWEQACQEINVAATIESQEQIQRTDPEHGFDPSPYHHAKFVLIDESHNFRNDKSGRFENLDQILKTGEPEKHVLLLTATPINNSVLDLYNQIKLISKGDPYYYKSAGIMNLETAFKQAEKNPGDLGRLYNIFEQTMVRRTRQFIVKKYPNSTVNGKKITFPNRRELKETKREYNIDSPELKKFIDRQLADLQKERPKVHAALMADRDELDDLDLGPSDSIYSLVNRAVLALHCAPYNTLAYKRKDLLGDEQREELYLQALVGLMKTRFFKRFESSLYAFDQSLEGYADFAATFKRLFHKGMALSSADFRKMLAREYDEDDITPEALIREIQEEKRGSTGIDIKDYDLKQIDADIDQDLEITLLLRRILEFIREKSKDAKLEKLIELLGQHRRNGDRVIVFSYFKDTINYLHREFTGDNLKGLPDSLKKTRFGRLSSDADADTRLHIIWRVAPHANGKTAEDLVRYGGEIDVLFSTDVISEGQNLQDVRILINYDLHWNPVRMIQRAGRIDRLNSPHKEIEIWNFFPEIKLDQFLKLIERLQEKITRIDFTVGLDASILGETIHPKDFNHIAGLARGDEKAFSNIQREAEIPSDEAIKEDLLDFLRRASPSEREEMQNLPLGVQSGFARAGESGVFCAYILEDTDGKTHQVFWFYYDRLKGVWTDNKFEIWQKIRCEAKTQRHVSHETDWFKLSDDALRFLRDQLKVARGVSLAPPVLKPHVRDVLEILDELGTETVAADRKQELMDFVASHGDILAKDFRHLREQWKASPDPAAILRKLGDLFLKYRIARQPTTADENTIDLNALKLLLGLEVSKT